MILIRSIIRKRVFSFATKVGKDKSDEEIKMILLQANIIIYIKLIHRKLKTNLLMSLRIYSK